MLVRLTDTRGRDVWINPIYVRAVRSKSKHIEIIIRYSSAMGSSLLKVNGSVEEVVEAINVGMPEILSPMPPEDDSGSGSGSVGGAGAAALIG